MIIYDNRMSNWWDQGLKHRKTVELSRFLGASQCSWPPKSAMCFGWEHHGISWLSLQPASQVSSHCCAVSQGRPGSSSTSSEDPTVELLLRRQRNKNTNCYPKFNNKLVNPSHRISENIPVNPVLHGAGPGAPSAPDEVSHWSPSEPNGWSRHIRPAGSPHTWCGRQGPPGRNSYRSLGRQNKPRGMGL